MCTGLMIKVTDEDEPRLLAYSWADTVSPAPQSIDWLPVSLQEEECDHIRCHQLQHESLPVFMAALDSSTSIKAVIVINTENSYRVDTKHLPEEGKRSVPVLIVTAETGRKILDTIGKHKGKVSAKVNATDAVSLSESSEPAAKPAGEADVLKSWVTITCPVNGKFESIIFHIYYVYTHLFYFDVLQAIEKETMENKRICPVVIMF